jgi:NADH-quinone oxidoreductase subunit I
VLFHRFTLFYPDERLEPWWGNYRFDPKRRVAEAGFKGRHMLHLDKCTGCSLCAIACENIAEAIEMVPVEGQWPKNRKGVFPQINFGRCVFCGFCVDACPFEALEMTGDYELSAYSTRYLIYTPKQLAVPPPPLGKTVDFKLDKRGAYYD